MQSGPSIEKIQKLEAIREKLEIDLLEFFMVHMHLPGGRRRLSMRRARPSSRLWSAR